MLQKYIEENTDLMYQMLKELCAIPAPSHHEEKRAQYCKEWLENIGAEGVYIDDALNVIYPINCENSNQITVFAAHTDTVFPDTEPMPYREEDGKIFCPGVGDDTESVVAMLLSAKFLLENNIVPEDGVLFVCNSCEEGLGNLKGTRQIFKDFEGRIKQFISFDSRMYFASDRCAGSHRYEVEVSTEGGHSYQAFGNENAIHAISKMVAEIYRLQVPEKEGSKTTYNVGSISGGTSVNTIAQSAKMLCEYRSDDKACLAYMQEQFERIFEQAKTDKVSVQVTMVGNRPCGDIEEEKMDRMRKIAAEAIESVIKQPLVFKCASTDCNIPLSMGIPAICVGTYMGGGTHTREEWIEKASMVPGLLVALKAVLAFSE